MSAQQQSRTGKRPVKPKSNSAQVAAQVAELQEAVDGIHEVMKGLKREIDDTRAKAAETQATVEEMQATVSPRATSAKGGAEDVVTISAGEVLTITERDYATTAERLIKETVAEDKSGKLSTTKLRGIYGLITNVYAKVITQEDFVRHIGDIQYLRVRMAYEAGREEAVKSFFKKTGLMALADDVHDLAQFRLYCRYAEALVAYFKFHGGKD